MMDEPTIIGGRYELGEVLGRGGMAEVRRARDNRLGRDVAIKQLRSDLAGDATFQERFRREAQAAAGLNHPNIVSVYDTGARHDPDSGIEIPYIVMELVQGETLRDIIRDDRRILPERAFELTQGVLDALSYSHKAGIVHRDIKPANVMLTNLGQVKVMDFGIARAVADTSATMTQTAAVIGTAQYLSPEQARGEKVDARSDIYSAGCLLYELLSGRPPFIGDSPVSVAYQHVREAPVPPSQIDGGDDMITPAMDAICLRALAKGREERYQSAKEMRDDITRLLGGQTVAATVPPTFVEAAPVTAATQLLGPGQTAVYNPQTGTYMATNGTGMQPVYGEQPPKKKMNPWVIGLVSLLVLLAISLIGYALFQGMGNEPAKPTPTATPTIKKVSVPRVLGYSETQAQSTLENAGLKVKFERVQQEGDTKDQVIKQNPVEKTQVDEGSEVVVTINSGPKNLKIPTVKGLSQAQAIAALVAAGFSQENITASQVAGNGEPTGQVIGISPSENQEVSPTTKITLQVVSSEGKVPNLQGMSLEEAKAALNEAGFGTIQPQYVENDQALGTVFEQNPPAGAGWAKTKPVVVKIGKKSTKPTTAPTTKDPTSAPTPTDRP